MDIHHLLVLIPLLTFSGVQANKKFFPEENPRSIRSTNDRETAEHHQHHHHDSMVCCDSKTEINEEQAESYRKAIMKCENETLENTGLKGRNKSVCFMNCVMEKLNLMEDNGRIKKKALEIIMAQHKDVINDGAKKKIEELCYDKKAGPLDTNWRTECNKESYNLVACAHQVKDMLCPKDKQIEGRHCDEYREEMKKIYSI